MNPSTHRRGHGDRGSAAVEVAILTPVFLSLICFVTFVGRVSSLEQTTQSAARDAARAASIHSAAPSGWAQDAATQTLTANNVSCQNLTVDVDASNGQPGGAIVVTVSCTVAVNDLTGLPLPGRRTAAAKADAVVDTYATPRS